MAAHELSAQATRDVDEILDYSLTRFGPAQAERYFRSLKKCFQFLAAHPAAGRERLAFGTPLRSHHHQQHVIFYRLHDAHILIVRVLHERMDPERHI